MAPRPGRFVIAVCALLASASVTASIRGGERGVLGSELPDQGHRVRRHHAAAADRDALRRELQLHRHAGVPGV